MDACFAPDQSTASVHRTTRRAEKGWKAAASVNAPFATCCNRAPF
jgi:hypothetical protein